MQTWWCPLLAPQLQKKGDRPFRSQIADYPLNKICRSDKPFCAGLNIKTWISECPLYIVTDIFYVLYIENADLIVLKFMFIL
jgi:hypothetical protein